MSKNNFPDLLAASFVSMVEKVTVFNTIPRSAGGSWEWVRDSHTLVRYREVGRFAWSYLTATEVADFNRLGLR
ncbi:hypothetical protein [Amnibacterium kyonggiense]|uniref:hypothetical protein n=1 Tax=Amnibacterium kyonggiense TaxID=595671 RepID=UPI00105E88B9|nr:hypothetical protein [Amnibacterium kyonggiense]